MRQRGLAKKTPGILCLVVTIFTFGCSAGPGGPKLSAMEVSYLGGIASYDQNKDNIVTCEEWRTGATMLFDKADKERVGFLTPATFVALATFDRTFLTMDIQYFDLNKNGRVEKMEFVERPNPAFALADKDNDCRLVGAELQAARMASTPSPKPPGGPPGEARGPAGGRPQGS